MIALAARDDSISRRLPLLQMILPNKLDCGFRGFGAAGREIDSAGAAEIRGSEFEQAGGEFFGGGGVELRGVSERDLRGLLGHGAPDFGDAMPDADHGGLACGIEKVVAVGGNNPAAFAADGDGERLVKISREEERRFRHAMSVVEL